MIIYLVIYHSLLNVTPFGIEDSQPHSIRIVNFVSIRNEGISNNCTFLLIQRIFLFFIVFVNRNDSNEINEDATLYTEIDNTVLDRLNRKSSSKFSMN